MNQREGYCISDNQEREEAMELKRRIVCISDNEDREEAMEPVRQIKYVSFVRLG